jgi:hypothetical protein
MWNIKLNLPNDVTALHVAIGRASSLGLDGTGTRVPKKWAMCE